MKRHEYIKEIHNQFFNSSDKIMRIFISPPSYPHDITDPSEIKLSLIDLNNKINCLSSYKDVIKTYENSDIKIKYIRKDVEFLIKKTYDRIEILYPLYVQKGFKSFMKKYTSFDYALERTLNEYLDLRTKLENEISWLEEEINSNESKITKPLEFKNKEFINANKSIPTIEIQPFFKNVFTQSSEFYNNGYDTTKAIYDYLIESKKANVTIEWHFDENQRLEIHENEIHVYINSNYVDIIKMYNYQCTYISAILYENHEFRKFKSSLDKFNIEYNNTINKTF